MDNFAPILIPTLNRFEHLKRCVKSLISCAYADKTDLYISLDYPLIEAHWKARKEIETYIENIHGFRSVNVIKRNENFGATKNFYASLAEVFEKHDRVIFSEDDNEFSPNFLDFINKGLEKYKDNPFIFSVSGYNYPIKVPANYDSNIYSWYGFSAWGVGLWKDKWQKIDWNEDSLLENVRIFLRKFNEIIKINKIANQYISALIYMLEINKLHGDGYICMYQFLNNMYSVFPKISRVRNLGHDGTGINCGTLEYDIYKGQELYSDSCSYELPTAIKPDKEINKLLSSYFKTSYKSQIKNAAKLLLIYANLYNKCELKRKTNGF